MEFDDEDKRRPADMVCFPTIIAHHGANLNGRPMDFTKPFPCEFEQIVDERERDYRQSLEDSFGDETQCG
jgi:hypothetical protein